MSMKNSGMGNPVLPPMKGNTLGLMAGNLPGPFSTGVPQGLSGSGPSQNSSMNLMGPPTSGGSAGSPNGIMNLFQRINPSGTGMFKDIMGQRSASQGVSPSLGKGSNPGNSFLNFSF